MKRNRPLAIGVLVSMALSATSVTETAHSQPPCVIGPYRADNAWQNWVVENRCPGTVYFKYRHTRKSPPGVEEGELIAFSCSKSTKQLPVGDSIIFIGSRWEQKAETGFCVVRP